MERKISFEIRKIGPEYAGAVADAEKACFSVPWSEETVSSEMRKETNTFLGAFGEEDRLLGYIGWQSVAPEADIFNVAVLPDARRNGIGDALVSEMTAMARENGIFVFNLEVRASNLGAIGLYEKQGFVFCGIRKNYYTEPNENALLMRLAFDGSQEMEDPVEIWDED